MVEPVNILGVMVSPISMIELLRFIEENVINKNKIMISNANVHAINLAQKYGWFRDFMNNAAINFCDGYGVMLGAKILGRQIPQRITYADAMWQFAELCAEKGFSLFLLGAREGVVGKAAQTLKDHCPNLKIVGIHHGYFNKASFHPENQAVIEMIRKSAPDILVVGFGMPAQEMWLIENWDDLNIHIAMNGGAVFDFISGGFPALRAG